MKPTFCAFVFGIVSIFYFNSVECYQRQCSDNEEYVCKNSDCISTCQNPSHSGSCDTCTYGCYCQENYWKDEETGKCVEMSKCPCEEGRVFRWGNPCIDSCDAEICPQYIVAGCFCPAGQCSNKVDSCVPKN